MNLLITKSMHTNHPENQYYHLKERLNKAKLNANRIRLRLYFASFFVSLICCTIFDYSMLKKFFCYFKFFRFFKRDCSKKIHVKIWVWSHFENGKTTKQN